MASTEQVALIAPHLNSDLFIIRFSPQTSQLETKTEARANQVILEKIEGLRKFFAYITASSTESFNFLEDSRANQKSLHEINIQNADGASLIAVFRNNNPETNPPNDFRFESSYTRILFGRHVKLNHSKLFVKPVPTANRFSLAKLIRSLIVLAF